MPGFLDNLEDYLAILRSADVSALAGNVLLAVSDRRGIIRRMVEEADAYFAERICTQTEP